MTGENIIIFPISRSKTYGSRDSQSYAEKTWLSRFFRKTGQLKFPVFFIFMILQTTFYSMRTNAQHLTDSIHPIKQVDIIASQRIKKEEAGMKETRIDTSIIKSLAHQDVSDILAGSSSVYIKNHGRGALATASFRGASSSHTQVEWNGLRINSPMLGMVDFALIPGFIIDELYLDYGNASIASRSGGLGGLIKLENKADWNNRLSLKYQQGLGSFKTFDEYLHIGAGNKLLQSKTRIYRNYSKNDFPFINKKIIEQDEAGNLYHPLQRNQDAAFEKQGICQEFYLRPGENTVLSSRTWIQAAGRSIPRVNSSEIDNSISQLSNLQQDNTLKSIVSLDHYRKKISLQMNAGLDLQEMTYVIKARVSGAEEGLPLNSASKQTGYTGNAKLNYEVSKALTVQARVNHFSSFVTTRDSTSNTGYEKKRNETSFFGGAYFAPVENLHFAVQLRKDLVSGYKTPLIYTLGVNYNPSQAPDFQIKWNFARNYHHPTLNDLYWQPGGNPDLQAEEGYSTELSFDYTIVRNSFNLKSQLTAFYSVINNWIMWLPDFKGNWQPYNIPGVRSTGVEFHMMSSWNIASTTFFLNGNINTQSTSSHTGSYPESFSAENSQLPYIPRISGNLFLIIKNNGYYVNYQHRTIGKRNLLRNTVLTNEGYPDLSSNQQQKLYAHLLNDISAGKEFTLKSNILAVEIHIDNLFNENYRNILLMFMPGRSYYLNLKLYLDAK